jgi:hypothetical protein
MCFSCNCTLNSEQSLQESITNFKSAILLYRQRKVCQNLGERAKELNKYREKAKKNVIIYSLAVFPVIF